MSFLLFQVGPGCCGESCANEVTTTTILELTKFGHGVDSVLCGPLPKQFSLSALSAGSSYLWGVCWGCRDTANQ